MTRSGSKDTEPATPQVVSFRMTVRLLRQLLTRQEKVSLFWILVAIFAAAAMDAICIGTLSAYTSVLAGETSLTDSLSVLQDFKPSQIAVYGGLALMGLFALKFVFTALFVWYRASFSANLRVRLSTSVYRKYMYAPWQFHLLTNSAALLRNIVPECTQVAQQAVLPLIALVAAWAQTIAILGVLLLTAELVGLFPLVPVGIILSLFLAMTRKRVVRYGRQAVLEKKESIKSVREGLGSLPESTILGKQEYVLGQFEKLLSSFTNIQKKHQAIVGITPAVMETAIVCGLISVMFTLALLGKGIADIGPMLVVMAAASLRLRGSLVAATTASNNLKFSQASVQIVCGELGSPSRVNLGEQPLAVWNSLVVSDVGFTYEGAKAPSLTGAELTLKPGDRLGIIGGSGSGKSTLVALMLGLLEPTKGSVAVDSVQLSTVARSWQSRIGYVPQRVFISDDTVERNVAFGTASEEIDHERVLQALEQAQLSDFILSQPLGVHTVAGEDGCRLSGGQRQRVGLARALYHQPEVLILDEATSSLDPETEENFVATIQTLGEGEGLTVVSIAHRVQALQNCSAVLKLEAGAIVDQGSYEQMCSSSDQEVKNLQ